MSPNIVVEVATFRLRAGADRTRFLAAASAVNAVLRPMPGFISRELLEDDDGGWLDLIHWASQEDAQRSIEALSQTPAAQPFLALIDPESVRLHHYQPVALGQ